MTAADLLQLLATSPGPFVGLVAYMVWDKTCERKLAREQNEAQKALATSLALLEAAVRGLK